MTGSMNWTPPISPLLVISVVIPAFNEELYLPKTLSKLQDAISMCRCSLELVVVDNQSTDRTAEVARSFGATVVHEPVHNIARVRNAGSYRYHVITPGLFWPCSGVGRPNFRFGDPGGAKKNSDAPGCGLRRPSGVSNVPEPCSAPVKNPIRDPLGSIVPAAIR